MGYDPIFAHLRWQHRQDAQWEQSVAADFLNRQAHEEARPPRVWVGPAAIGGGGIINAVRNIVGASLDEAARDSNGAWQYQPVDQAEQQRLAQQREDVYRFRDQRQQAEANAAVVPATGPAQPGEPDRRQFAPSPIVAKSADQLDKAHTPPQPHAPPPLDNVVQPTPRPARSPEQPQQPTVNRLPLDTAPQPRPQLPLEPPAQPK